MIKLAHDLIFHRQSDFVRVDEVHKGEKQNEVILHKLIIKVTIEITIKIIIKIIIKITIKITIKTVNVKSVFSYRLRQ